MQAEQFNKLLLQPALLNSETVNGLKDLVDEFPYFQAAWLLYLKNLKQIKSPEFDAALKKAAVQITDRKLLYKFLNTNFHKKHVALGLESSVLQNYKLENKKEPVHGDSLIDKFLLEDPGLIRQTMHDDKEVSNSSVTEVEQNSVAESDEIITETLATIYYQQKNYKKALEAYEKLSLKYPEKSVYFATRIEEIEKLKNT